MKTTRTAGQRLARGNDALARLIDSELLDAANRAFIQGINKANADIPAFGDAIVFYRNGQRQVMPDNDPLIRSVESVLLELNGAVNKFPAFNSSHEGLAVIEEEFLELRDEVFSNPNKFPGRNERMREEAVQLAAMAIRFLVDVSHA